MHGPKSVGKSPTAWNIGLSVAAGLPFCGLPTTQVPVLYLETDTPRASVIPRLKKLDDTYPPETPFVACWLGGVNLTALSEEVLERLQAAYDVHRPGLVIVNTARRATLTLDFNASDTPSAVYEAARAIFPGSAILFVAHDRKHVKDEPPDSEKEMMSGSLAWANDAQSVLHIEYHGSSKRITHTGSQVSRLLAPLLLHLWDDGSHLTLVAEEKHTLVRRVMASLPPLTPAREADAAIAEVLECSERQARTYRLAAFPAGSEK